MGISSMISSRWLSWIFPTGISRHSILILPSASIDSHSGTLPEPTIYAIQQKCLEHVHRAWQLCWVGAVKMDSTQLLFSRSWESRRWEEQAGNYSDRCYKVELILLKSKEKVYSLVLRSRKEFPEETNQDLKDEWSSQVMGRRGNSFRGLAFRQPMWVRW